MCMGGGGSPTPPEVLPEAPRMPEVSSERRAGDADKRRRAAATGSGAAGTILTGSRGVAQQGATATKTLLGE